MTPGRRDNRPDDQRPITIRTRIRTGALVGIPLGLAMGAYAALSVSDNQSLGLWIAYLAGGLFAFVTFGAFVGAMTVPRRGDD